MEEIILTIEEILEGRRLVTMQEIRQETGKKRNQGIRKYVSVIGEGKLREDTTIRWYHFEMGGIPCVCVLPKKKFEKTVARMKAQVMMLEEALEGRRQVTLDEVRAYMGEKNNKKAITQMVNVTNKVIGEYGVRYYCFDMGGMPCVYKTRRKYKKPYTKIQKAVMTLEESLEGRRQVTLNEVMEKTKSNKRSIHKLVKIQNQGITKDGLIKWYHFDMDGIPCVYTVKKLVMDSSSRINEQEWKFAEENIGLFFKFFSLYHYEKKVYYDAALEGFLESVIKYNRDKVTQKYKFSTVAYKKMNKKCSDYRKKIQKTISIEKMKEERKEDWLIYGYINSIKPEEDKFKEVMEDIAPYINAQQKKMLALLHAGYGFEEIKDICGWSWRKERIIREEIIQIAKRYYGYERSNKPCEVAQFVEIKTNDAEERSYEKHVLQQV